MDKELNLEMSPEEIELIEFLWERKYSLDDVGISPKNVFDWSKQGLLLDPVKPKGRRKYSIVEFVWLKLIVGLREFGLSLDAIRNLRGTLLELISFPEYYQAILDPENEQELLEAYGADQLKLMREQIREMQKEISAEEMQEFFEIGYGAELRFINTLISYLVLEEVKAQRDFNFFINSNGDCLIGESEQQTITGDKVEFFSQPYIKYPLRGLLSEFLQKEDLITTEQKLHYRLLSPKELELLELMKTDNLVSLIVRFDEDQQIKLIETEENITTENVRGKITDFLVRNKYQEIICKSQDGNVTSVRRKTKYK